MTEYLVPFEAAESEFTEKRSRFISHVWRVEDEEEARARIEEMKKRYYDARHNCWCYVLEGARCATPTMGSPRARRASLCWRFFSGRASAMCAVW